jgi:hypothetical protein
MSGRAKRRRRAAAAAAAPAPQPAPSRARRRGRAAAAAATTERQPAPVEPAVPAPMSLPRDSIAVLLNQKQRPSSAGHEGAAAGPLVQLVALHRFLVDNTYQAVTGQDLLTPPPSPADVLASPRYNSGYDCVIADGRRKLRCVVSSALYEQIHGGTVRAGTAVFVADWIYPRYNDIVMGGGDPLLIITKLSVCARGSVQLRSAAQLEEMEWAFDSHRAQRPLVGHRSYYLHLLDDGAPYGPNW